MEAEAKILSLHLILHASNVKVLPCVGMTPVNIESWNGGKTVGVELGGNGVNMDSVAFSGFIHD